MEILTILLTGLVIGVVAKFLMPGDDPGGFIITTLLGIAGAFVGGVLSSTVGITALGSFGSFVLAVIGAMILLGGYRFIKGRS